MVRHIVCSTFHHMTGLRYGTCKSECAKFDTWYQSTRIYFLNHYTGIYWYPPPVLIGTPPPVLIGTPPPVPTGTNCTNSGTEGVKRKYPPH